MNLLVEFFDVHFQNFVCFHNILNLNFDYSESF
jgi:hypothetical protein